MDYMLYLADMPLQLMDKMQFREDNIPVFIAWLIAYTTGFLLYLYAWRVERTQKVTPYPLWIHCYMISIDIIGTITFVHLAFTYDFFWFFCLQSIALPIWICLEVRSIVRDIKSRDSRQVEFGRIFRNPVTQKEAILYCLGIFAVSFCLNMYGLSMLGGMDNAAIWIIYPFTNYVYAIFTWRYWGYRAVETGTREYNSLGLQIVILAACFTSWCPYISWYWSVTPFLHQPWFYIGGIAVTGVCIFNLVKCAKLPKYEPKEGVAKAS